MREGVTWHDGEPLTADDVVFTFEYLKNGPGGETGVIHAQRSVEPVDEVVAESPTEVVFRPSRAVATFDSNVAGMWGMTIVPEHVCADVDDPARLRSDEALMGSGPYRLEEYDESAGSYLYVANDEHFMGPPLVQRLEFVPAPDALLALERGDTANELLDALGLEDGDGDGVRERPDGTPREIDLLASSRFTPQSSELIAEYLAPVGIATASRLIPRSRSSTCSAVRGSPPTHRPSWDARR